eukprot:jgi/Chlat1/2466/Chrsp171S08708
MCMSSMEDALEAAALRVARQLQRLDNQRAELVHLQRVLEDGRRAAKSGEAVSSECETFLLNTNNNIEHIACPPSCCNIFEDDSNIPDEAGPCDHSLDVIHRVYGKDPFEECLYFFINQCKALYSLHELNEDGTDVRVVRLSDGLASYLGVSLDTLRQTPRELHFNSESSRVVTEGILEAFRTMQPVAVEVTFVKGGSGAKQTSEEEMVTLEVTCTPFPPRTLCCCGKRVFNIAKDITGYKAMEASLTSLKQTAEAATEAKTMFLASMSHDIRTPLNGMLAVNELLLDTCPPDSEQAEMLRTMKTSGETLLSLCNDILDMTRVEENKLELEPRRFDPAACCNVCVDMLSTLAAEKGLELSCWARGSTPRALLADDTRLRQIVYNLLSNAVKFSHAGDVTLTVSAQPCTPPPLDNGVSTSTDTPAQWWEVALRCEDTGVGVSEEDLQRLFKPFSQASGTRGGSGLGLAIASRLAELMHGGLRCVSSSVGIGSVFECVIKCRGDPLEEGVVDVNSTDEQWLPLPPPALFQATRGKHALFVHTSARICEQASKQLRWLGMTVRCESSASAALEALALDGVKWDVVIVDAALKTASSPRAWGFNGVHVVKAAQALSGNTKVILLATMREVTMLTGKRPQHAQQQHIGSNGSISTLDPLTGMSCARTPSLERLRALGSRDVAGIVSEDLSTYPGGDQYSIYDVVSPPCTQLPCGSPLEIPECDLTSVWTLLKPLKDSKLISVLTACFEAHDGAVEGTRAEAGVIPPGELVVHRNETTNPHYAHNNVVVPGIPSVVPLQHHGFGLQRTPSGSIERPTMLFQQPYALNHYQQPYQHLQHLDQQQQHSRQPFPLQRQLHHPQQQQQQLSTPQQLRLRGDRQQAQQQQQQCPVELIAEPLRRMRILLVDDNLINQKVMAKMLQSLGFIHIQVASDGVDALEALRASKHPHDIVLMDVQMPRMDGLAATRRIREQWAKGPESPMVLILTANAMNGDREACLESGADSYLSKPVRKQQLVDALGSMYQAKALEHPQQQITRQPSSRALCHQQQQQWRT